MRLSVIPLLAAAAGLAFPAETIDALGYKWTVLFASDWKIEQEGGADVLRLIKARPQEANPRRPIQFALAETPDYLKFTLDTEIRRDENGLIIVYAFKDAAHFNYVHFSKDLATKQPVHSGIFHVYGGDRVRISPQEGDVPLPTGDWYKVQVIYDGTKGEVQTKINGRYFRCLHGVDMSLAEGRVGFGSFFQTGSLRNFRLKGETKK
jgi:hypothetical protein